MIICIHPLISDTQLMTHQGRRSNDSAVRDKRTDSAVRDKRTDRRIHKTLEYSSSFTNEVLQLRSILYMYIKRSSISPMSEM